MKRTEDSDHDCDIGFNTLICEEDDEHQPYQNRQQVYISNITTWRHGRLTAVILVLLAAVLLIVDISLGVHYNNLRGNHLTTQDVERIENALGEFEDIYKTAIQRMNDANKQLDNEMSQQIPTNWELDHEKKRKETYEQQIATITKDLESMRTNLPLISGGCRHCPPGWILMNSVCYYFPLSDTAEKKTWKKARDFCQMSGGDLFIIDTRDKQNSTIKYLKNFINSSSMDGFWIGLRILNNDGIWTWVDGREVTEGYWLNYGDDRRDKCAALFPFENIFKAWGDSPCDERMRWICEKAPTSLN